MLFSPIISKAADISEANKTPFGPNVYIFDPSMSSEEIQKIRWQGL